MYFYIYLFVFRIAKEIEVICGLDILFQCFSFILLVSFTGYLITIVSYYIQINFITPTHIKYRNQRMFNIKYGH